MSFKQGQPVTIDGSQGGITSFLTSDGLTLYWDQNDGVLSVASRDTLAEGFRSPYTVNNLLPYPRTPFFARNDRVLYYSAYADLNLDKRHIFRTELTETGFSPSEIVVADDGYSWQDHIAVTPDELTIYFNKLGDIYVATRSTAREGFSDIREVEELNTPEQGEYPTWVSDDGCRILFDSVNDDLQSTILLATKPKT